ncbi:acetylornithine transaminase [Corynebacterium sp. 153RC1]|uniref:acetylornithine transaminase n=1 Tax=unclassified Corynebacterium TaxID=2624378 RepID=UPI00211CD2C4|nr:MULTISPECIES: acetylornithine transaminase [unclassified Corynebacterium]MCQ9370937.1 acetylornithine transaminase [Corynebacterium sp. 35RC1]MCQ9353162.1 acetylornithine transaminase [Corynebacterium sp. 209RC1]MCQ9353899.1 acetylornithine transaminase [Corynebacterium sp. 1222RC1]MCQ9356930.1 acetylornithine transaminase [Corynebacterium sp. 122RC1]MCQ9359738.1 acetylornithine transaminase [Corynebacterium sp. 142RC1]
MTNTEHAQQAWQSTLMDNYGTPQVALASGNGSTLVDVDGKTYIDMLAGIAVNSLGYGHPKVVAAVSEQVATLAHSSNLFATQPVLNVAAKLKEQFARVAGEENAESTRLFFCNSGTEANEAVFKLARLTGRSRILAATHGFHGRTMGALAMTGQPDKQAPFAPLPQGVEFFPYGDLDYVRKLVEHDPSETAAIILEPIQGETGVIPAPEGFLEGLRELCDAHGILLAVDEVQTGIGRTGQFWAFEHATGVVPDIISMAKGLGAGLPIGAVLAHGKAATLFSPGKHGTTFGGNPLACAAAGVVLEELTPEFLAEVQRKGEKLRKALEALPEVQQVRGRGLMLGVVLHNPVAKQAVSTALENGLILNAPSEQVLRLTPPLVITDAELEDAVQRIANVLTQVDKA